MTDLVVVASSGGGTIPHVNRVISGEGWEQIFVIGTREGFNQVKGENLVYVEINPSDQLGVIKERITEKLRGKITGLEVGLNIISGSGKEHMAVVAALLGLGVGFRLIALTPTGVQEI